MFVEGLESRRLLSASLPLSLLRLLTERIGLVTPLAKARPLASASIAPSTRTPTPIAAAAAVTTPAVTFDPVSGQLKITGTDNGDLITLTRAGPSLALSMNGTPSGSYATAGMTQISIDARGGDDTVWLDPAISIPATVNGNAGNDALTAGS